MLNRANPQDPVVLENRKKYLAKHGFNIDKTALLGITYSADATYTRYEQVNELQLGRSIRGDLAYSQIADALITTDPEVTLFLALADCVGTVIHSEESGVLMVSHLGRHSLEKNGGYLSVQKLVSDFQVDPGELKIWLSPAPSKESYPIWALAGAGMKETVYSQLISAGVHLDNITDNSAETDKDQNYYSHSQFKAGKRTEDGRYAVAARMG